MCLTLKKQFQLKQQSNKKRRSKAIDTTTRDSEGEREREGERQRETETERERGGRAESGNDCNGHHSEALRSHSCPKRRAAQHLLHPLVILCDVLHAANQVLPRWLRRHVAGASNACPRIIQVQGDLFRFSGGCATPVQGLQEMRLVLPS
jgi:hypothetical protein